MKILMIIVDKRGALIQYGSQLCNALSKKEEVTVIAPLGVDESLFDNSVNLFLIPMAINKKSIRLSLIRGIFKFMDILRTEKPDIVHIQHAYHFWTGIFLPLLKRYNIVTTIHDPEPHIGQRSITDSTLIRNLHVKCSKSLIVHGKNDKSKLMNMGIKKQCYVVPIGNFGFYTEYIDKNIDETNSLLFFGAIRDNKGLDYLLKAFPKILREVPDVKLIIAGDGNLSKYDEFMDNLENIEIHNKFIPKKDVAKFFQRSKLVVLPYIEASQSGIIPVAYSFKKPVIVTNVGSIAEVVDDGITGVIIPPKDIDALANASIKLLKNDKLREKIGENAYKKAKRDLSWDKIADRTIQIYKETSGEKKCESM